MLIRWPLVWRKTMMRKLDMAYKSANDARIRMNQEIEENKQSVARIADRCSMLRWFKADDHYEMRLRVDPRAFSTGYRQDRDLMSEMIARKVHAELASSQFIKSAHDEELRALDKGRYSL